MTEPTTLEEAYAIACRARVKGNPHVRLFVAPMRRFAQFNIIVWDGVVGRVRDRLWHEEEAPNGCKEHVVDTLVVDVPTASVIEAYTRARLRELEQDRIGSSRMRVNHIAPRGRASTSR